MIRRKQIAERICSRCASDKTYLVYEKYPNWHYDKDNNIFCGKCYDKIRYHSDSEYHDYRLSYDKIRYLEYHEEKLNYAKVWRLEHPDYNKVYLLERLAS